MLFKAEIALLKQHRNSECYFTDPTNHADKIIVVEGSSPNEYIMYSVTIEGDSVTIKGTWVDVTLEGEEASEILDDLEDAETVGEIQYLLEQAVHTCTVL